MASHGTVPPDSPPQDELDDLFYFRSFSIRKQIAFAYALSTLYNVMFFMQFMSTPYKVKSLGISDSDYGYVQTLFGVLQMCGGPVFGYIIQRFGVKTALFTCYTSTFLSSLLLYGSYDLKTLVISRLPVFFMHGQQGHQTLLSLLTKPGQERTNAFGRMGLTFGIGFILTPLLSLSSTYFFGDQAALITLAILSLVPFYVMEYSMEQSYDQRSNDHSSESNMGGTMTWKSVVDVLRKEGVINMLIKKNLAIVPMLLIFSILQMFMIEAFAVTQEVNSIIQMLTGVCIMFSNGFGVIWLRTKYDEQTILIIGIMAFVVAYILLLHFSYLWMIALIMPFISLGMSLVATVADSLMTSLVEERQQGVVLGISTGFNSFVRTFSPALGGIMLDRYGFSSFASVGLAASSLCLSACLMARVDDGLLKKERSQSHSKRD